MANGKFEVKELSFNLSQAEFVIDCGFTGLVQACGQKTAKSFALRFGGTAMDLDQLKKSLEDALVGIEALQAQPQPMFAMRAREEHPVGRVEVRDLRISLEDNQLVVRCGEASVANADRLDPRAAPFVEMAAPISGREQLRAQLEQALKDLRE